MVIDPLMAFLPPEVAATIDQCVRQALTPLAGLAERTDCAVLLVRHLRRRAGSRAIYRGQGSMGIIGAVRTALLAAPHPADPDVRVLAVTKIEPGAAAAGAGLSGGGRGGAGRWWSGPGRWT